LDKIKISYNDGTGTIIMPKVRNIEFSGEVEYSEVTMANGRKTRDVIGFRPTISAEWDWLPAVTMTAVHAMIRTGQFLYVEYPDPALGDASGYFSVSYPVSAIFRFIDGSAVWHGVKLKMTAQEVI